MSARRLLCLAVLAAAVLPGALVQRGPTLCPIRRVTGWPCPACGLTRSWSALARLQPRRSLQHHQLGPATLLLAGGLAVADGLGYRPRLDRSPALVAAGAGVWLGVWLGRLRDARDQPALPG